MMLIALAAVYIVGFIVVLCVTWTLMTYDCKDDALTVALAVLVCPFAAACWPLLVVSALAFAPFLLLGKILAPFTRP